MYFLDSARPQYSGIWYHRVRTPTEALKRRGHAVRWVAIGGKLRPEDVEWPDVVIFGRTYPNEFKPLEDMKKFKNAGKRVLYDIDDDHWAVSPDNPSQLVSNSQKDQYEGMMKMCDGICTPSAILGKKIQKLVKKPVYICPNGIEFGNEDDVYKERPRKTDNQITIGYKGASSHWKDLSIIVPAMEQICKKYDNVYFWIYGMAAEPLESAAYTARLIKQNNWRPEQKDYIDAMVEFYDQLRFIRLIHTPFMPPEIHPGILASRDFDIGICPLIDCEFNHAKSCIKFYEYAATGTVTLASDVEPYKSEVDYRAKNTTKDWYDKLEKLITDEEFRKKLQEKQTKWVTENRSVDAIGLDWELACQLPSKKGAPKVLNQIRKLIKK